MAPSFDNKLIKRVDDLTDELKDAKSELNKSLVETAFYKKVLTFLIEENIVEKKAKAQALKLAQEFFKSQV
jgi:hypothetical protein